MKLRIMALALAMMFCLLTAYAEEPAYLAPGDVLEDFALTAKDDTATTLAALLTGQELALIALDVPDEKALAPLKAACEAADVTLVITDVETAALTGRIESVPAVVALDGQGTVLLVEALPADDVSAAALLERLTAPVATPVPAAPLGQSNYILHYVDQNGDPVEGLIANICDDSACMPMFTDAQGTIFFQYPSFAYHIQVIRVPEGYAYDLTEERYLDKQGGEYTFVVTKE